MFTNFQYLGIYEDAINDAIDTCESALKQVGASVSDIDSMNEDALCYLKECGSFDDITNSIISAYFSTVGYFIKKYKPDADVDYYVNGNDSHLYIDREEVYA